MFCTSCGTQIADTANYCSHCGQATPLGRQQHFQNSPPPGPARRLYRSLNHKMLAGICGGLAEYIDADPTLVRLLYVAFIVFSGGLGLIAYLVAWMIIPLDRGQSSFAAPPPMQPGAPGQAATS